MSDALPVQGRISGVPQAHNGGAQIVKILKVELNRSANHICSAAAELIGGLIKRSNERIREIDGNLFHDILFTLATLTRNQLQGFDTSDEKSAADDISGNDRTIFMVSRLTVMTRSSKSSG